MDDWRLWLTREEHEHASIAQLKKSLAASRALVEKVKEGLHCHYAASGLDKCSAIEGATLCSACQALALTEETA